MKETSKSQYHWKCVVGLKRDKEELKMVAICQGKDHKCVFIGKENEGSRGQEIGSVIDEVKLPAGKLCRVFQSALGGMDMEHSRVTRTGIRAGDD